MEELWMAVFLTIAYTFIVWVLSFRRDRAWKMVVVFAVLGLCTVWFMTIDPIFHDPKYFEVHTTPPAPPVDWAVLK